MQIRALERFPAGAFALATAMALAFAPTAAAQGDDAAFLEQQVVGKMNARSIGPANFSGRVVDIEADPTDPATIYVAYGSGGVWKTTNAGNTFAQVFDSTGQYSIGDIALAPSNPAVVYVGTGEANNQRSSYWGYGLHKSTDGGETWTHVGLVGTDHIGRVVVHPQDPDVVWVAAAGPLYSPGEHRGLYKTSDGGKTWKKTQFIDEDVGFIDVVVNPQDPDVLYAASYERRRRAWDLDESGPGSGIWKSTDGGETWKRLKGGLPGGEIGRIGLSIYPKNPDTVFAIVENRNPSPPRSERRARRGARRGARADEDAKQGQPKAGDPKRPRANAWDPETVDDPHGLYPVTEHESEDEAGTDLAPGAEDAPRRPPIGGEVYRSDDAGESWKKINTSNVGGRPHYYYGQIRVDPNDDRSLYVLGMNVYTTADGGENWRTDFGRGVHVDHHALWINPADSDHVLLGNDGGLCITRDRGRTWDYHNDLPVGQFYAVGVDNRMPYTVYGGTQDNGSWGIPSRSTTNAALEKRDAFKVSGGDGFYVAVDPSNPDIVYSESQFGGLLRTDLATGARSGIRPRAEKGSPDLRFNWMSPIVISPHDPRTIYFGSQYLHKSVDRGENWTTISADLTTNDELKLKGDVPHCTLTTISESPLVRGRLFVGTDDGRVWLTRDDGNRWEELTDRFDGLPRTPLWVSRVEASPSDAETVYVAFTGYREDIREPFLYISTDCGGHFRRIGRDRLPEGGINVVREHPRNPDVLFVGHESGACVSLDGGGSWLSMPQLPPVAVHDLVVHPMESDLVVATHGRGFYVVDITPLETMDARAASAPFVAFAPRTVQMRRRAFPYIGYPATPAWRADEAPGRPVFQYYLSQDADDAPKVEVLDAAGEVLFTRNGERTAGLHEVDWQVQRRRGRGRGQQERRRSRSASPGEYAVRFTFGSQTRTFPLRVLPPAGIPSGSAAALEALEEFENGAAYAGESEDRAAERAEEEAEYGEAAAAGRQTERDV